MNPIDNCVSPENLLVLYVHSSMIRLGCDLTAVIPQMGCERSTPNGLATVAAGRDMPLSDQFEIAADLLARAPFELGLWGQAIEALARAVGFQWGHLAGAGPHREMMFNVEGGLPDGVIERWLALGGPEAISNPRADAVFRSRFGEILSEPDFLAESARARNPMYQEVYIPFDLGSSLMSWVPIANGGMAIFTAMRDDKRGPGTEIERLGLRRLNRDLGQAVKLQELIEVRVDQQFAAAMEATARPVVLCDLSAQVTALSPAAEVLLSSGDVLTVRSGRLRAAAPDEDRRLQAAMRAAAAGEFGRAVLVFGRSQTQPFRIELFRLPDPTFGGSRLGVVIDRRAAPDRLGLLRELGLTTAEAAVALAVTEGFSTEAIAQGRVVSIETVRGQIKSVAAKLGVHRRTEIAASVNRLV